MKFLMEIATIVIFFGIIFSGILIFSEQGHGNELLLDINEQLDNENEINIFYKNEVKSISLTFYKDNFNWKNLTIKENYSELIITKPEKHFCNLDKSPCDVEKLNFELIQSIIAKLKNIFQEKKLTSEDKKFLLALKIETFFLS